MDKKRVELEQVRAQKKRIELEFKRLEHEEEMALTRLSKDLHKMNMSPGYQSEPTTPPEYRDQAYYTPSVFGSRNRFSSASLTSPPGLNRMSGSGSQVTSPPNELASSVGDGDKIPSRYVLCLLHPF